MLNLVNYAPASVSTVAIFLSNLVQKSVSDSVYQSYFYSIKWFHDRNFLKNPCDSKILHLMSEGAKRILCKPVLKKEPITSDIIHKLVRRFGTDDDKTNLVNVRLCNMFLVGFSGFLRFNEIVNIRVKDVSFHDLHMRIFIQKSKTDVYRQGREVVIASSNDYTCPVY